MPIETMSIEKLIAIITPIVSFIAALVGGTLVAILNRHFEQQKQTNEHDVNIFNQSNEILTEQKLLNVASFQLLESHSIVNEDLSLLKKWCDFFKWTGSKYLDKKINTENQKLLDNLNLLVEFIRANFDVLGGRSANFERLCLQPELDPARAWNPNGDSIGSSDQAAEYEEYSKELQVLIKDIKKHHSNYRLAIKKRLKI